VRFEHCPLYRYTRLPLRMHRGGLPTILALHKCSSKLPSIFAKTKAMSLRPRYAHRSSTPSASPHQKSCSSLKNWVKLMMVP
jgi:hypothetical protein